MTKTIQACLKHLVTVWVMQHFARNSPVMGILETVSGQVIQFKVHVISLMGVCIKTQKDLTNGAVVALSPPRTSLAFGVTGAREMVQ